MNIAIAGYGIEGRANYRYFSHLGEVTIVDERTEIDDLPQNAATILGEDCFSKLKDFDMVIRTASLAPKKIYTNGKVWSATNEFFAKCPAPIIGVTGTKGKGTTCSLIAEILRAGGKKVHLVGNIGIPALDILAEIVADDIVVFELSSFQLWDIEASPHIAVVLMVEPDHLNVHDDFNNYVNAKAAITKYQKLTDVVIYHPTNIYSSEIASRSSARIKQRYMTPEAATIQSNNIVINEQSVCSVNDVSLMGAYNLENICAAISAARYYVSDMDQIAEAVRSFKGLEHRLEFVAIKNGVKYYNDSFSSAPTATIAAISAFHDPTVLIVGGFDRGIELEPLADAIIKTVTLKKVLIIGQIKDRLKGLLDQKGFTRHEEVIEGDIDTIVQKAAKFASPGEIVLLSPGCASFDMFKNFAERGMLFKQAVGTIDE